MKTLRLKEFPVLLQRLASGEVAGSPIRAACVFFVLKSEVGDYCRKVQLFIITARSCDPPPPPQQLTLSSSDYAPLGGGGRAWALCFSSLENNIPDHDALISHDAGGNRARAPLDNGQWVDGFPMGWYFLL